MPGDRLCRPIERCLSHQTESRRPKAAGRAVYLLSRPLAAGHRRAALRTRKPLAAQRRLSGTSFSEVSSWRPWLIRRLDRLHTKIAEPDLGAFGLQHDAAARDLL